MKCCICKKLILDKYGHNPAPIKKKGRCCDDCNRNVVVPERMKGDWKE